MTNNNTSTIDNLLRKLPAVKTDDDFTEKIMSRIAALPAGTPRKLKPWHIILITTGSLLLIGLAAYLAYTVWEVEFTFLQTLGKSFAGTGSYLLSIFEGMLFSKTVFSGLIVGALLLLLDGWLRKQRKQRAQEA